jgi:S1/P1 Nuclease
VGHRAIARLAAERLTSRARIRVATLLGVPDTVASIADALAAVSTWADEVRVDTKTGAWHYIDLTLYDKKGDFAKRCHNDNCVTARIRLFREQLKGKRKDPKWTDAEALKFVVHFVGDVHQPLHAISDADQGGNCELLDPPVDTARNLHALCDGGMLKDVTDDDRALPLNSKHIGMACRLEWLAAGPAQKLVKRR